MNFPSPFICNLKISWFDLASRTGEGQRKWKDMCVNYSDSIYGRISINRSGVLSRRKRETASGQMAKKSPLQLRSVAPPASFSVRPLLQNRFAFWESFAFWARRDWRRKGKEDAPAYPPSLLCICNTRLSETNLTILNPTRVFLQKAMYFRINLQYEGSSWIEFKMPY